MSIKVAITKIRLILKDRIKTSRAILREHAKSEVHYPEFLPDAVAFVNSTHEVSEILKICNEEMCIPPADIDFNITINTNEK